MSIKMLVFDYRKAEELFFNENKFLNYDIKFFNFSLDEQSINKIPQDDIDNASIISVFIDSTLTPNVINKFKELRLISTRSTGFDHINKQSCIQRNISVINVQNYGETTVAEFTIALILNLIRKLPQAIDYAKKGIYKNISFIGKDMKNLTLGIVGTGAIGSAVCKLAKAFDMKVIAYDIRQKQELSENYGITYTDLEYLIKNSDIISLHLPYTGDNYHMFSQKEFNMMKQNSYFINVSRGELVELKYLKENLDNGKISGAALDVIACECIQNCEEFAQKMEISSLDCFENSKTVKLLLEKPNVFITPHIAYESQDAINYILKETFDAISNNINGGNKNRVI